MTILLVYFFKLYPLRYGCPSFPHGTDSTRARIFQRMIKMVSPSWYELSLNEKQAFLFKSNKVGAKEKRGKIQYLTYIFLPCLELFIRGSRDSFAPKSSHLWHLCSPALVYPPWIYHMMGPRISIRTHVRRSFQDIFEG